MYFLSWRGVVSPKGVGHAVISKLAILSDFRDHSHVRPSLQILLICFLHSFDAGLDRNRYVKEDVNNRN